MPSPRIFQPLRSLVLSGCLLLVALALNACGSSEPVQKSESTRTLRLTAVDSASGEPLDSARAINRTVGDTLQTDSAGQFVMRDVESALHVFDVSGYGYHTQRHFAVLVEPTDTILTTETALLPQELSIDCEGHRPFGWDRMTSEYGDDSSRVRIQLLDVFAQGNEVQIQPILVNDLPTNTIFLPENFGALGHYDVLLYDDQNNRIDFEYKNAPPDEGHRIYSKKDLRPVVPKGSKRLDETTLVLDDSLGNERTLYARMYYTFASSDTLRATSATTFPDLNLDSLQVPAFDTVRTDGRIRVPDSLVLQRDTTITRVVGIDTTVTRSGYVLFSTLRDSNAAPTPEAAQNLLFIPDSVKARARRDSLEAIAEADTTVPEIDTTALAPPPDGRRLHVVERTDRARLDSLLTDTRLSQSLLEGLPPKTLSADSLLAMSQIYRTAALQPPTLTYAESRVSVDVPSDPAEDTSAILSAPRSDSLFQMVSPDTASAADTTTPPPDANPFVGPEPGPPISPPQVDSLPVDSLRLTVRPDADSVTTDSIVTNELSDPPDRSYWFIPDSLSVPGSRVLAVDPSFFQLRARPVVDTTVTVNVRALLPDRVGRREEEAVMVSPQQVVRIPAGTYRSRYLQVWKKLQASTLRRHYCQIFPFPLRSEWNPASIR